MSFALAHQNKTNKSGDAKTSTPTKHYSSSTHPHHHINNLNENSADYIFHLQRSIGNQGVQRLMRSKGAEFDFAKIGIIQPKLKVSQPGDVYEQEADRVAEQVMRMSVTNPITSTVPNKDELMGRKCSACEMKEDEETKNPTISRKRSSNASLEVADEAATNEISNIRSSRGSSLDANTREFMESRFGYDFGNVRIHSGEREARSAESMNALAYTIGNDVVFRQGYYQPNTLEGRRLLAHELTHVVQQKGVDIPNNIDRNANRYELGSSVPLKLNQSSTGVRVSQTTTQPLLQQACGVTQIGAQPGCKPTTGEPLSIDRVHFAPNCDTFLTADDEVKVKDFADSMTESDEVNVHGFASMDGNAAFNEALSCARAERVTDILLSNGIDPSKIHLFQHGRTPGPPAERQSAVLESTSIEKRLRLLLTGTSSPAVPQLTSDIKLVPKRGNCGEIEFVIRWQLSRNSDPMNGGFIIQDVNFTWKMEDCGGKESPESTGKRSPLKYFEAWRVFPGDTKIDPDDALSTDNFAWTDSGCTKGKVTIEATAQYHDGVPETTMPAHMTRNNPDTFASELKSSKTDPALGGNVSRPVKRNLPFSWNCCPCRKSLTVLDDEEFKP
jgi:outer membrane protein OmpA-like peptidoglycan-associated protein